MKNILIRCDSSLTLGLGHVKRCLLLAQRLKQHDNYLNISFATQNLQGNMNLEILKAGFNIYTLKSNSVEELSSLVEVLHLKLLIIDSYDIDLNFEKQLRIQNSKFKILSFDDMLQPHCADIVLNHGIQAKKSSYQALVSKNCKLFCGSKYTLLRDEFFKNYKTEIVPNSVAIILGGNDALNLSLSIAEFLLKINAKHKITVITTSVNPNLEALQDHSKLEILVDISNIAEVVSSKALIVCASGGTLFEVMALKKKFVNIEVVVNQNLITQFLEEKKIHTTIKAEELTMEVLKNKIEYVEYYEIYDKLNMKFSKHKLAKKIVKEIK